MNTNSKTLEFYVPSGTRVIIREQNGRDDEIISRTADVKAFLAFNLFIKAIVLEWGDRKGISLNEVMDMKLRDKYYILLQSRIFSLGADFHFNWDWEGDGKPTEYQEDLNKYLFDYSKPEAYPWDETMMGYFAFRLPPYVEGTAKTREISLSSMKTLRYNFQDGHSEKYLLEATEETNTINSELYGRKMQMKLPGNDEWVTITSFESFSAREMMEIRTDIKLNDPVVELVTPIEDENGRKMMVPFVGIQDFYFPVGI